jgi:hypothetical protein
MRLDIDEKVFRIHPGPALSLACSAKLFCEAVLRESRPIRVSMVGFIQAPDQRLNE